MFSDKKFPMEFAMFALYVLSLIGMMKIWILSMIMV